MPFTRFLAERFSQGSNLILAPDLLPSQSWRLLKNSRLSRLLGVLSSRPGMSAISSALGGIIYALWTRFGTAGDTRYAHVGTTLYRLAAGWTSATSLSTSLSTTPISFANMIDGAGVVHTYCTHATMGQKKDDGITFTAWGVPAATAVPSAVALATDLSTAIDAMDAAANWTVSSGLSAGPTNETNIKQEGTGSVTITVAASTLGTIARSLGGTTNLDTLTGGDATVKADDYIHLWVRADRPERVSYLQLDFDLDTTTVANAFRTNYYSMRLPGLIWLNQGRDQWSKIQVPKSQFQHFGTTTSLDWADVECVRISVLTTNEGACQLYFDDLKLRGGTDIVGSVRYAICYRNNTTKARGNPLLDSDRQVTYTSAIEVDRQRTSLTISNIIEGGASHPGDTQITHIRLYRSIDASDALQIDEFVDTTASPYVDDVSVASTLLTRTLETDNDVPPNGHRVFGPGNQNRLFMLVGLNDLYYSKAWEADENRAENWPPLFRLKIGDGSEQVLTGLVTDTAVLVWTDEQTYTIQGLGADTYLPLPLPNSRGIVGAHAVTEGDGSIFFVSQDGIYQQHGTRQTRITDAIAPFFKGLTVAGQAGWSMDHEVQALIHLAWHPDPLAPFLLMTYANVGSSTPDAELYLGRNPATGRYEHISFDTRGGGRALRALHSDVQRDILYAGSIDGYVYQVEDETVATDAGTAIDWRAVTASETHGAPYREAYISHVVVEANTNAQDIVVEALYDKQSTTELLTATLNTQESAASTPLPTALPEVPRHDVALKFSGSLTSRVDIARYGWDIELQPELVRAWDSGIIEFGYQTDVVGVWYTLEAAADITVNVRLDQQAIQTYTIVSTESLRTSGRFFVVAGVRGRALRVQLQSPQAFRVYDLRVKVKPYGTAAGARDVGLMTRAG